MQRGVQGGVCCPQRVPGWPWACPATAGSEHEAAPKGLGAHCSEACSELQVCLPLCPHGYTSPAGRERLICVHIRFTKKKVPPNLDLLKVFGKLVTELCFLSLKEFKEKN